MPLWWRNGSGSACATAISACRPPPTRDISVGGLCGESKTSILDQAGSEALAWIAPYTSLVTGEDDLETRAGGDGGTPPGPFPRRGQAGYRLQRHRRAPDGRQRRPRPRPRHLPARGAGHAAGADAV